MIGFNIGSQITKYSSGKLTSQKEIYTIKDFQINQLINDFNDRVILSIIQFKHSNILYGALTKTNYKKYYLSTFDNLSRLIGFIYNIKINQKETEYFNTDENYDNENTLFTFKLNNDVYKIPCEYCVCIFLSKIFNSIKKKLENTILQKYVFSIPDYYTYYQKESLKNILNSLELKNFFPFINESTAITMYYGISNYNYLNYDKKYIIFIDMGHSKTSFILSQFTKKEFIVKNVVNIPFLGGRDFNKKIFKFCLEEYKNQNERNLKLNGKNKIKLMEEIEKARKNLTINTEIKITVEAIEENNDFEYIITREKFEELIKEELILFENEFQSFYNNVKQYEIIKIEMGGQLMRTPILEKIIEQITNKSISKTIALDECHSLGALYYGIFIFDNKKFEELEIVKSYNLNSIYYSINNSNKNILISYGENYPKKELIKIDNYIKDKYIINFEIFYEENKYNELGIENNKSLYKYIIDFNNIKQIKDKNINLDYNINESNEILLKVTKSNFTDLGLEIKVINIFSNKGIVKYYRKLEKYFKEFDTEY